MILHIYTDGGSRGNPGLSAIGVYIVCDSKKLIATISEAIGISTNNIAEYKAVLAALHWLQLHKESHHVSEVVFHMDSQLVRSQIIGLYKITMPHLRELFFAIKETEKALGFPITYIHIPREQNKQADRLVNMALDNAR